MTDNHILAPKVDLIMAMDDLRLRGCNHSADLLKKALFTVPESVVPVNWLAVEARISEFVNEYEMVGEDEQGRDGHYTPNESERALILDAMHGVLADDELMALLRPAAPVAAQPDVTQQTLDDVMAGIPARDAEIEALRKEIEVLQAQLVDRSPEMQGKPVDESPILQGQQQPASDADGLPLILHDLNTSAGGRGFVAEYFESRVGRYDFTRYIRDRLAADFACALAAHLSQQDVLQAEVLDMVRMLEANEWTDHCGQSELGKRLEWAITALQNRPQNIPEIIPEPAQRLIFPTMLRKMWSGSEVQAWLDDELAKLTKLSSQQVTDKTDAGQDYNDGFSDGVILALQLMTMHGDYNGTQYCELFNAAGPNQIVERAIREGMWEMSGLSQTPAAVERRAAIEAARKEAKP